MVLGVVMQMHYHPQNESFWNTFADPLTPLISSDTTGPKRPFVQVRSTTGSEGQINESLLHFAFGGLLDLLGLRDGVFPGVILLSRRR
jgi:hypothetical protein